MAGFSLRKSDDDTGIWTPFGPEPTAEEQARGIVQEAYQIRPLGPQNMAHCRQLATRRVMRNGVLVDDQESEEYRKRYEMALADYLVVAWQGVYLDDAKTEAAECNLEHKYALYQQSLERQNFWISQARLYADDDTARKEAERQSFRPARTALAGL